MDSDQTNALFTIGLIVNPVAGTGGPRGEKGSDHLPPPETGQVARAMERARRTLGALAPDVAHLRFVTCPGSMGEALLAESGFDFRVEGTLEPGPTSARDTRRLAARLCDRGIDLLLFAGGDGTARDICSAVPPGQAVLGIPAGVKMHSGVFAVNPEAAGQIVRRLVAGDLVDLRERDVRDIDEEAFRRGSVRARHYGEMQVPEAGHFVQRVKESGREVEALVLDDIAAEVLETMDNDALYIIGPGTTTRAVTEALGVEGTLLGVDLVLHGELVAADVDAGRIESALDRAPRAVIVVTPIGGQGVLFGRGNQQLTPAVLRRVGRDNLLVLATKTKITELGGRPLLLDTDDPALDRAYSGLIRVVTGYRDSILYPLSAG
jgi:predicted polyphosphate/ATP-dependent NAD kinase